MVDLANQLSMSNEMSAQWNPRSEVLGANMAQIFKHKKIEEYIHRRFEFNIIDFH